MRTIRRYSITATLAAAVFIACTPGERSDQSAASEARNLTLAPAESTAAIRDVPAQPAQAAPEKRSSQRGAKAAAPKPAAPAPAAPAPAPAPTTLTAPAGTAVALAARDTISTRYAKAGDSFTATVRQDVTDASGRVVIPAGATVEGTIAVARPAPNPDSSGELVLEVKRISVRGTSYAIEATVESKDTVMKGRGVTKADAARVGAGAAAGAIAGKLLGKDGKGAVIGGAVGAATGAAVSRAVRDIDVVLPKGAGITIRLVEPLTVKRT